MKFTKGFLLLAIIFLCFILIFTSPVHIKKKPAIQNSSVRETLGGLNVTEFGLPYGSSWGLSYYDLNNTNNNGGLYGGSNASFRTYVTVYSLPAGTYKIYSTYTVRSKLGNFNLHGFAGEINIGTNITRLTIRYYRVNVSSSGLPGNSTIFLDITGNYIYQKAPHNFTAYMPDGNYSYYAGANDYYSSNGLEFDVNGHPSNTSMQFEKCYNVSFTVNGVPNQLASYMESYERGLALSYNGFNYTQFSTTYEVPNGSYNVTVIPSERTYRVNFGYSTYFAHVTLVSHSKFMVNVSGHSKTYNLSYSMSYTPINFYAKLYVYRYYLAIPSILILAFLTAVLARRRLRKKGGN